MGNRIFAANSEDNPPTDGLDAETTTMEQMKDDDGDQIMKDSESDELVAAATNSTPDAGAVVIVLPSAHDGQDKPSSFASTNNNSHEDDALTLPMQQQRSVSGGDAADEVIDLSDDAKLLPTTRTASMDSFPSSSSSSNASGKSVSPPKSATILSPSVVATATTTGKCIKCHRRKSAEGCLDQACLACCTQTTACLVHKRGRDYNAWKAQVLAGDTPIQLQAADIRSRRLPPKCKLVTREPAFKYTGDTIVIWNVREYLANPKWRDDAIRKSTRRLARAEDAAKSATSATGGAVKVPRRLGNSRRRFGQWLDTKFKESLEEVGDVP
jgi:hypothetical protein